MATRGEEVVVGAQGRSAERGAQMASMRSAVGPSGPASADAGVAAGRLRAIARSASRSSLPLGLIGSRSSTTIERGSM